nr:hypothetical protein [Tanacetum cinerariifolium]
GTQRTVNVTGTREKVGSPVVQKSGIQCFNCKEYGHFAKEHRKPKRVKDSAYHKEKMLLCVLLQAEQCDLLVDTDEEVNEQELEAHYSYMAKIQEVPTADSGTDSEPVEQNEQNDVESDDEHVALANLIANLKLDVDENKKNQKQLKNANTTLAQELKECKTILAETSKSLGESISVRDNCLVVLQTKQTEFEKYKAFNDCTIDYDKLKRKLNEALGHLAQKDTYVESLKKEIDELESDKAEFLDMYDVILQECVSKDVMCSYLQSLSDLDALAELQLEKHLISLEIALKICKEQGKAKSMHTKFDRPSVVRQPNAQRIPKPSVLGKPTPFSNSLDRIYFQKTKSIPKANVSEGMYRIDNRTAHTRAPQLPQTLRNTNPRVSTSIRVNHKPTVSRPQLKSNQSRGFTTSKASITISSQLVNFVMRIWRLLSGSLHVLLEFFRKDIVIGLPKLKYVKDQLCSSCELSKAKRSSFKSKAVPSSKGRQNSLHMDLCGPMRVASINGKKYIMVIVDDYSRNLQALVITIRTDRGTEFLNKTLNAFFKEEGIEHQTLTARTPEQNVVVEIQNHTLVEAARTMLSASQLPLFFWAEAIVTACYTQNRSIIIPTRDKKPYHIVNDRKSSIKHLHIFGCICYITRDGENLDKMKEKGDQCILVGYSTQSKGYHYDNPDPVPQRQDVYSSADADVPSQQELDMLFGPLYDEFFNAGTNPSTTIPSTSAPSTHTNVHAEENNNDQEEDEEQLQDNEFTNPFCAPTQEEAESSSHNIGNSNVPTFNQPQVSEYRWTKDHPLEQVHGNLSRPVQTRR